MSAGKEKNDETECEGPRNSPDKASRRRLHLPHRGSLTTRFHFANWISVEFELYISHEFQRLKAAEQAQLGWSLRRELSKINYHIHTDAIKQNLIPATLTKQQMGMVYANEADVLNVALFGFTAKEWRDARADLQGNVRDYATVNQLICLSNMESLNSVLIKEGLPQPERLQKLNQIAISQMTVLESIGENKLLK